MSNESKQKILRFLEGGPECIRLALQHHALFKSIIPGNPSLVIRYATELTNPAAI